MRVLMFSNAPPGQKGGAEASFSEISTRLAARGHEVLRLYNAPADSAGDTVSLPWPSFWGPWPSPRGMLAFLRQGLALRARVRRSRPDVIVVHFVDLSSSYFAALRALGGPPLVLNARGSDLLVQVQRSTRHRKLISMALRRADHVVAISAEVAQAARRWAQPAPVEVSVIPNGVDVAFWGTSVAAPDAARPLIVAAGRLDPVKGFDVLVRAFARVRRQVPTARLRVLGEGAERERLVQLAASLGVADAVELPGWADAAALRRAYQEASVVAVPSRSEGMGNTALEALAAGAPVVASRVGGLPDLLLDGRAGCLVPAEDEAALADALAALLADDSRRAALREGARVRVAAASWAHCIDAYEQLLTDLANTK